MSLRRISNETSRQLSDELADMIDSMAAVKGEAYGHSLTIFFNLLSTLDLLGSCLDMSISKEQVAIMSSITDTMANDTVARLMNLCFPAVVDTVEQQSIIGEFVKNIRILKAKKNEYEGGKKGHL